MNEAALEQDPQDSLVAKAIRSQYNDYRYFARHRLKIRPKGGVADTDTGLVPLAFNDTQEFVNAQLEAQYKRQGFIRALILKCRQPGISTYVQGRFYWHTTQARNRTGIVISYDDDSSRHLFSMTKTMYENDQQAPETRASNERALEFNTPAGDGLRSKYIVKTANAATATGRSFTAHYLHASEVAWWMASAGATIMSGMQESIPAEYPSILGTEIIWETTANGFDPLFHPKWEEIERAHREGEETDWITIFVPWFYHSAYRLEINDEQREKILATLTDHEKWLLRQTGLNGKRVTTEQLAWRRWKIANSDPPVGMTRQQFFKQEYPATAEEAFISSGKNVFDTEYLMWYRDAYCVPPKTIYRARIGTQQWEAEPGGTREVLKVWEEPVATESYIVTVDPAEGLEHGDYTSMDIVNHRTGAQVAHWHGHITPKQAARVAALVGARYNHAIIAVERNNHGLAVIDELVDEIEYPNLYYELVVEHPGAEPRKRYGWYSRAGGGAPKTLIVDTLVEEVRQSQEDQVDYLGIRCRETIEEMITFEIKVDESTQFKQMGARQGKNDDRVMTRAMAGYIRRKIPYRAKPIKSPNEVTPADLSVKRNPEKRRRRWAAHT